MRKYDCHKTSSFLDRNLRLIAFKKEELDKAIREGVFRFHGLKERLVFIYYMLHMKRTVELARRGDHISLKDYYKLIDLWLKIFVGKYRTA